MKEGSGSRLAAGAPTNHESRITNHGDDAPVVTFDGPGGSGKGTLSRALAAELGWHLLDSGALYRLVALAARRESLSPENPEDVTRAAELAAGLEVEFLVVDGGAGERIMLAGEDVSAALRDEEVGGLASYFAAEPGIREALLTLQRGFRVSPGLIADGRDMGTVVFPDAELKLFVTASPRERARRRHAQLSASGASANIGRIYKEIVARDERDAARVHSPLKPASDAVVLDTTGEDVGQTLDRVRAHVRDAGLAS